MGIDYLSKHFHKYMKYAFTYLKCLNYISENHKYLIRYLQIYKLHIDMHIHMYVYIKHST
jgi:hypothetical protein